VKKTTIELSRRVRLTHIRTEKFKTAVAEINVVSPLDALTAAQNALLPRVLRRGTLSLPDITAISETLDELYGAKISPRIMRFGDAQYSGLGADFIDDDIAGEPITARVFELLGEMLCAPPRENGLLRADYVEGEKQNLADDIESLMNDKGGYASAKMLAKMCADEAFGTYVLGSAESALEITAKSLTEHYKRWLGESRIEIIYVGASEAAKIEALCKTAFEPILDDLRVFAPPTQVMLEPAGGVREFTERFSVEQGQLVLGFRMGKTMREPNYPALAVFEEVYCGGVTSKLFLNVRERLSLCYSVGGSVSRDKGILIVRAGVDFDAMEAAREEILAQLDKTRAGEISAEELEAAKKQLISGILAGLDSQGAVAYAAAADIATNLSMPREEFAALCDLVSAEEIVEIAKNISLDTVYYLKGRGEGA